MALKPSDYQLVQVHWNDAESGHKWLELEDAVKEESMECVSVGWLLKESVDRIVIASSMSLQSDSSLVSGHLAIPRAMVIKVKELGLKKPRTKKIEVDSA